MKINLNNMLTLTLSAGSDGLRKLVVVVLVMEEGSGVFCPQFVEHCHRFNKLYSLFRYYQCV